ncbi:MAG: hypothetical protein ACTSW4_04105 [Candidatus Ranarchaeia archaeon]
MLRENLEKEEFPISTEEDKSTQKREITGGVTLMGAPVSWVAIFGAILGASSIIPVVVFIGGETAMLSLALSTSVGLILGPFGGFAAGLIGGIIGMFLAPTAYWAGPLNIFEMPLICLIAGLIANRKWIPVLLLQVGTIVLWTLVPWFIPGAPWDNPLLFLTPWYVYVGIIFNIALVAIYPLLPNWLNSKNPAKIAPALFITTWMAREVPHFILWVPFNLWYSYPAELNMVTSFVAMPAQVAVIFGISMILGTAILTGLSKTKLRKIPGAVW